MRKLTVLTALALVLVACGSDPAPITLPPATTPSTSPSTTTTSAVPATTVTTVPSTTTTAAPATTTTVAPATTTTTTPPVTTTTAPKPSTLGLSAYFYMDEVGEDHRPGPYLVPVYREVPYTVATARAAMDKLLAGPNADEANSIPAITSFVPHGSGLVGLTIEDGIATVDLNAAFDPDQASAATALRIAQVVFTLTQFPSVEGVVFTEEGRSVAVQTSQGQTVTRPVGRADYRDFQALVSVDLPAYGGPAADPLRVTGVGAVFEAQFEWALTDGDGLIIDEGFAMTTEGNSWAPFDFTIDYDVDRSQRGALIVWMNSAEDGSKIDVREYPVLLTP